MDLFKSAKQVCEFLLSFDEVKSCNLYGSIANEKYDEYSDIDIEIDVSGTDNSVFLTKLPERFTSKYNVIFADYAPSLAPNKYVVSIAISYENPFLIVDIACVATPHITTMQKNDISSLNNKYEHILKLFVANLKHSIRGIDCFDDIKKMYDVIFLNQKNLLDEQGMLQAVFDWLEQNAQPNHLQYIKSLYEFL